MKKKYLFGLIGIVVISLVLYLSFKPKPFAKFIDDDIVINKNVKLNPLDYIEDVQDGAAVVAYAIAEDKNELIIVLEKDGKTQGIRKTVTITK